ncbi:SH3 domain-containing protein [Azospirillum lipoferum]|uniref:SH3 domain-containing protein n=1 Tax=Azospirillum lipoferum TaxID=193 RepID=A0A5A9GLA4_AZOLI|nr:SH3 domain-containing protein [Azospirillum lipoferum]
MSVRVVFRPALVLAAMLAAPLAVAVPVTTTAWAQEAVRLSPLDAEFQVTGRTNVREQPSTKSARITVIDAGTRLRVSGKVADAPWYAVTTAGGRVGFIAAEQLRPVPSPSSPPAAAASPDAAAPPASPLPEVLARLDRMQTTLNAIDQRLAAAKAEAVADAPTAGLLDGLAKLQEELAAQIREQRDGFVQLGSRLDSMEMSVQPAVDWAKQVRDKAAPVAEEAQGWLASTWGTVYNWVTSWLPWTARPATTPPPV